MAIPEITFENQIIKSMIDYRLKLLPEHIYHIYSRANGKEPIFLSDANYKYFLNKYKHNINPIADTYSYCLMPNHFHFLLRFRAEQELISLMKKNCNDASDFIFIQFQYFLGS
ncbi:MAG TPA: hypothetical protein VFF27_16220, partial [Bacteroidia bacterium]|nr:hypothetical protein [Bacteroidia bacterium]